MTKHRNAAPDTSAGRAGDTRRASSFLVDGDEYCVVSAPFQPEPGFSGLTAAEVEVAKLAVSGLSNKDIAEKRGSSVRTVANQMASVLHKLNATSRVQVAARLGELGKHQGR